MSTVPEGEEREGDSSVPYTREDFLRSVDGQRTGDEEMEIDEGTAESRFIPPRLKISDQE